MVGKPARAKTARPAPTKKRGHLDIRLFDYLEVALDGERTTFATPRKSLQLLAYLWLHPGAAVSREYLAFLLYPDDEEDAARAKLRATLAELPRLLPAPAGRYVTVDSDKVTWNRDADVWIDVTAFVEAAGDRARIAEAINLYRGDLLPEIYDEWLDVIRERLRNTYVRCLDEHASEARRNADFKEAIETARKVLAIDPWREDIVRRIIAMRYESGDRAGALSEYRAFSRRLLDELGTQPMAETVALADRIEREEAPAAPDREPEPAGGTSAAALPFVGRRGEMERLLEAWNRAARGRGGCAFIGGEIGIGKSRLAHELAHAVEERGGRVLVGTTSSPESVPYESVTDALRGALAMIASLKPDVVLASVATLLPEIHGRIALPVLARLDPEPERLRLFESVFRSIAALAAARPLLLVLEDVQWAQTATTELLQFLLRRITGIRAMLVITYRAEDAPRSHPLHRLRREAGGDGSSLSLGALSVRDVEALLATFPDAREYNALSLAAASQGNPLFLAQLIADARETLPRGVPASLQEAVERRIERLSNDARTIAQIAACIGDRFSHDALREVSAWEEVPLNNALDELFERRIVREASGRGIEYSFSHNLVLTTVARDIPAKDAAVRRRRIARVLEELYPERFSELSPSLAAHYEYAGDIENAARCYVEAVRRSIEVGALDEAGILCSRALALDLPLRVRAELLLESITIESRRGNSTSRSAALVEAEQVDLHLGDATVHRDVLLARIEFAATIGDVAVQETAIRALDSASTGDARWSATAHLAKGSLELTRGNLPQALAAGEAALACSRAANDNSGAARASCLLAKVEAVGGNLAVADSLFADAARLASEGADPALALMAMSSGCVVAYEARDLRRCRDLAERCIGLAVKLGDRYAEARAAGRMAFAAPAAEARRYISAATRISEESGDKVYTAAQLVNLSFLETKLGFFDRGYDLSARASALFEQAGDERGRIGALSNLTYLKACLNDAAGARAVGAKALDGARRHGFRFIEATALENLAMAEAAAGDFHRAIRLAQESFDIREGSDSEKWSAKTLADVALWRARSGDVPSARATVQHLLSGEESILSSDWPSYCFWIAAQIMRLVGDANEATRLLRRALRVADAEAKELDPDDRASFLSLSFNRDIMHASKTGEWPDPPR